MAVLRPADDRGGPFARRGPAGDHGRAAVGLAADTRTSPATLTRTEPSATAATEIGSSRSGRPLVTISAADQDSGGSASARAANPTLLAARAVQAMPSRPGPKATSAATSSSATVAPLEMGAGAVQTTSFAVEWATWTAPSRTIASHSRPEPSRASDIERTPRSVSRTGKSGSGRKPLAASGV